MKKIFIILFIVLLVCSCRSNRSLESLSEREKEKLNAILHQRRQCISSQINMLDDPNGTVKEIAELVNWKCSHFNNRINELLYKDFGVSLGKSYMFVQRLQGGVENEVAEAVLTKRRGELPQNKDIKPTEEPITEGDQFLVPVK